MNNMKRPPRIKAASPAATVGAVLTITWTDGRTDTVDLTGWIATGGELLAPLLAPSTFRLPRLLENGSAISWGDDDGDVAIDAVHLKQLADEQSLSRATELISAQTTMP